MCKNYSQNFYQVVTVYFNFDRELIRPYESIRWIQSKQNVSYMYHL